ncbi:MAG: phosphopantetheine-binding protein [Sulfurovaceae bacterium]|nr:phosphopantetheine-binding protein [Sulfurovaceae bacterium]MDD5548504.1 phosphopantetheine-binding protein [Sulfurovaceae bacterium]
MSGSQDIDFKNELKSMIIQVCEKDIDINDIDDNSALFGANTVLQLDSLDALQLSMEVQKRYGIILPDSKAFRKAFSSINAFADFIKSN